MKNNSFNCSSVSSAFAWVSVTILALALTSGPANAEFVLIFDDPATLETDFRIVDQDEASGDANPIVGQISANIDRDGLTTFASAVSAQDDKAFPKLVLSINGLVYNLGSLEISLTDTDFAVSNPTTGQANVLAGTVEDGQITFDFFGDSNNQEFVKGFDIVSFGPTSSLNFAFSKEVTTDPVGSLTLSAFAEPEVTRIFTTFTMGLRIGPKIPSEGNCPPSIIGVTVDSVGNVGDGCVISDAIIENGDVEVKRVDTFIINTSEIVSGDINIEDVTGSVEVDRNKVRNGGIAIKGTSAVVVRRNIVDGKIKIRGNVDPRVINNVTNGDIVAEDNTGRTAVSRNNVLGNSSIEVDDNEVARVIDNKAGRDITCEDNQVLTASGNSAERKLDCVGQR